MTISNDLAAPLVAVVGATGLQGGSVINSLVSSPRPYRLRGITRDSSKPKAKSLSDLGVEMVSCTLGVDNGPKIEDAFRGATYVFIMTNFWEHLDGARETAEGKAMVDSASKVGVKLLLISSEPNATKASDGKLTKVFHFDAKAAIVDYARETGAPFVEIQAAGYMNNLTTYVRPQPQADGTFLVRGMWSPGAKHAIIDTYHDFGLFVQLAIESEEYNHGDGKVISAYSEWLSLGDQVKILSQVTGKTIQYQQVTEEQSRAGMVHSGMPPHLIDDMVDMNKFHEYYWEKNFVHTDLSTLTRQPRSFEEYCQHEDWSSVLSAA